MLVKGVHLDSSTMILQALVLKVAFLTMVTGVLEHVWKVMYLCRFV